MPVPREDILRKFLPMYCGSVLADFGGRAQSSIPIKSQFFLIYVDVNELGQMSIRRYLAEPESAYLVSPSVELSRLASHEHLDYPHSSYRRRLPTSADIC